MKKPTLVNNLFRGIVEGLSAQSLVEVLFKPVYQNPLHGDKLMGPRFLGYRVAVDLSAPVQVSKFKRSAAQRHRTAIRHSKCLVVGKRFKDHKNARKEKWHCVAGIAGTVTRRLP